MSAPSSASDIPPHRLAGDKTGENNTPSEGRTLAWTSSIYFAEGLPWSILHQVAAEYFTAIGVSPAGVGRTSLLHGPMLFKVLWSPLVELWGTLRTWMVLTQAIMGVLVGILAFAAHSLAGKFAEAAPGDAGSPDTTTVWILLLLVGVLSAIHDIACDGFYMETLDEDRQAKFSGVRVAAFRAAMLVGSAGLVFLGGLVHWLLSFGVGALLLLLLAVVHQIFLPRTMASQATIAEQSPVGESTLNSKQQPLAKREFKTFLAPFSSFLRQDAIIAVIAFLLLYKMADALMFSMSTVLLGRELGIGTDLRGMIRIFSILSGIMGAIWGGAWIARRGLGKTLFPITLLMVVTEPLYAVLASWAPELSLFRGTEPLSWATVDWARDGFSLSLVTLVIVIEQICGGLATAAQVVFIMRRCDVKHKTAHFAFATALYSLAQMGIGAGSGVVYQAVGSVQYFWIVSALGLPAVALSLVVPRD